MSGDEVMTIPGSAELEARSRAVLERPARVDSFILEVSEIGKIVVRGDELDRYVGTKEGQVVVVNARGRRNVMAIDHRVILIDPHDNISEIEPTKVGEKTQAAQQDGIGSAELKEIESFLSENIIEQISPSVNTED